LSPLFFLFVAFVFAVPLFLIANLIGILYQQIGLARDARRFPASGRLIDIGGAKLHADIAGAGQYPRPCHAEHSEGSPPVVLEAGIAATSLSWCLIQSEIAKTNQTIAYDRAGLGWSETINEPRDLRRLVEELRALLDRASIPKPRILVAHSFGGLIALAYASRHPQELAGLVLVDPVGIEEWANPSPRSRATLTRAIFLAKCGHVLAHLGVVRFALSLLSSGARTAPKLIARATSGRGGAAFAERIVGQIRKLPPEVWPVIQSHWCDPKCFRSMARQLAMLPECAAEFLTAPPIQTPFILLSAGDASPAQRASHERLIANSRHGTLQLVADSGHWIQLDRPDAVLAAISKVVSEVRQHGARTC
jgi:pimeloyl-ACP methyl ester carboxylesterase